LLRHRPLPVLVCVVATALAALTAASAADAAYLSVGTSNTSNTTTTLTGSSSGAELKVVDTNSSVATSGVLGLLTATSPTAASAALKGQNAATNGIGWGVYGSHAGSGTGVFGTSVRGMGVYGRHTSTAGSAPAVQGESNSQAQNAVGVLGRITDPAPGLYSAAVRGINAVQDSPNSYGVWGSTTFWGTGVRGTSPNGLGVLGEGVTGVAGNGNSSNGVGVFGTGESSGVSGVGYKEGTGVEGNANWVGVSGRVSGANDHPGGQIGVAGREGADLGLPIPTSVFAGVLGETASTHGGSFGVYGLAPKSSQANASAAVRGESKGTGNTTLTGVWGSQADTGVGVYGQSPKGNGVKGVSTNNDGVFGSSTTFAGVAGSSNSGNGIYGESASGYAGYFSGWVHITGNLEIDGTCTGCTGHALKIDHPLDPAHKYLQHSAVVSPQMKAVYDGVVTTNRKGFANVRLPDYFQALNRSFRYQLTVVGKAHWDAKAAVWDEIQGNRFTIRTDQPNVKVSWQVTGIRHDRYANAHRIQVVVPKAKAEQGRYLHPELYGKPRSAGIGYRKPARLPSEAARHR
jgi:hypothetical protein